MIKLNKQIAAKTTAAKNQVFLFKPKDGLEQFELKCVGLHNPLKNFFNKNISHFLKEKNYMKTNKGIFLMLAL